VSWKQELWLKPLDIRPRGAETQHREIMIHASLRFLVRSTRTTPLPTRAFARNHSTHWPRIATQHFCKGPQHSRITIRTMASIHIDDKVKTLINNSYPQTQDAGDDPHKLSSIAYPHVEVRPRTTLDRINMQLTIITVHPA
jgi:hypothetical protein